MEAEQNFNWMRFCLRGRDLWRRLFFALQTCWLIQKEKKALQKLSMRRSKAPASSFVSFYKNAMRYINTYNIKSTSIAKKRRKVLLNVNRGNIFLVCVFTWNTLTVILFRINIHSLICIIIWLDLCKFPRDWFVRPARALSFNIYTVNMYNSHFSTAHSSS